jgi:hypothetical protein
MSRVPWNKGLTKYDPRVRMITEKMMTTKLKLIKEGKLKPFANFGKSAWSEEEKKILKEKYPSHGWNISELKRSKGAIKRMAYVLGVKRVRTFLARESKELAYLLGVIHSDGNIHNNSVRLICRDFDFAQAFKKSLDSLGISSSLKPLYRNHYKGEAYQVYGFNSEFAKWVSKLTFDEMERIVAPYKLDFLRGLYDGDGNLHLVKGKKRKYLKLRIRMKKPSKIPTLKIAKRFLENLGFHSILAQVEKGLLCLGLYRQEEIIHFLEMLKPSIKRRGLSILRKIPTNELPKKTAKILKK